MKFGDDKKYERLLEAYESGDIDRRSLLRIIGGMAARAPWINCLRRYRFPRLLMPSILVLPPVEC